MTYQSNTYSVSDTVSRATNVGTGITERENKMANIVQTIRNEIDQVQSWIDEARGIYPETGGGNFLLNSASKRLEEIKLLTIELRDEYEVSRKKRNHVSPRTNA